MKQNYNPRSYAVIVLILLLLSSCSQKITIYSLDTPPSQVIPHSQYRNKTIKIAYPKSIVDMMSRDIPIRYASNEQSIYRNSIWAENINRLTMAFITEVLETSQLFKATINYSSYIESNYILEIFIHQMHHRIVENGSYAVVSIRLNLLDSQSRRLIKTKRFDYRIPTRTQDAKGYIHANQEAFNRLQKDMLKWIVK